MTKMNGKQNGEELLRMIFKEPPRPPRHQWTACLFCRWGGPLRRSRDLTSLICTSCGTIMPAEAA